MIIDAHHHVWDPAVRRHAWLDGLPTLNRRFGLDDFTQVSTIEGVTASVLVQVLASTEETEDFLALAAGGARGRTERRAGTRLSAQPRVAGQGEDAGATVSGPVAGVVGWVDLDGPDVGGEIARLRAGRGGERLAGIRHLVQDEPDPDWLRRPGVRRGLRAVGEAGLAYDILVRPEQLPAAVAVTGELDGVRFVLDHGAKPDIAAAQLEPWASLIRELAGRPNVSCKVSGLVTEAGPGWTAGQIAPYVDHLVDCFGPGRVMFGSDWPVCTLAASYGEVMRLARDTLARRLGPADLEAVFATNAISAYRLELAGA
jgi:L-fuconolactonase